MLPEALCQRSLRELGLGRIDEARKSAERAIDLASDMQLERLRLMGLLALARIDLEGTADVSGHLHQAEQISQATGISLYRAEICQLCARSCDRARDQAGCERELREAHRLYTEMGATGHAERVAKELT